MDVLVTGAGGRIGAHLTRRLLAAGHRVRALTVAGDPMAEALGAQGAEVVVGDLTDAGSLVAATRGVDVVCHLAAALTLHGSSDERLVEVNLRGTFNLLQAVRDHSPGLQRFVYVSSDAVYWRGLGGAEYLPVDERHPLHGGSVYGATKVGAEQLCRAFLATYGIPCAIMRPTATADPADLADRHSVFARRWHVRSALDWYAGKDALTPTEASLVEALSRQDDRTERMFVLVAPNGESSLTMLTAASDAAAGLAAMIEPPEAVGEAFNIGPADPHVERDFVRHLGRRLGLEVVDIPHPATRPSWYVSSAKAATLLHYAPVTDAFALADAAGAWG